MPRVKVMNKEEEKGGGKEPKEMMMSNEGVKGAWQLWHTNGTRCPKGTVPIRRSTVHDVLRAKSLFDFGKKQRSLSLARRSDAPDVVSGKGHEVFYLFSFFIHFILNYLK